MVRFYHLHHHHHHLFIYLLFIHETYNRRKDRAIGGQNQQGSLNIYSGLKQDIECIATITERSAVA